MNQPFHESVSQWTNESTNHWINEWMSQWSLIQWNNGPMNPRMKKKQSMNQWLKESVNQLMAQWAGDSVRINESVNQCTSVLVSQWIHESVIEWVNVSMKQWSNESLNPWIHTPISQWINERRGGWMNGLMGELPASYASQRFRLWAATYLGYCALSYLPAISLFCRFCNRTLLFMQLLQRV